MRVPFGQAPYLQSGKHLNFQTMDNQTYMMPLIGDKAPSFEAETTQGKIRFPEDFKGQWVILFSHPSDFTPSVRRSS